MVDHEPIPIVATCCRLLHSNGAGPAADSAESKTSKYRPSIVAKAEQVLADLGLRRSGKSIQSAETAQISRPSLVRLARNVS